MAWFLGPFLRMGSNLSPRTEGRTPTVNRSEPGGAFLSQEILCYVYILNLVEDTPQQPPILV